MPFIICKDCQKPAEVAKLQKGNAYYTKNLAGGCQCGTDQRRGKARQEWLNNNMKDSVTELVYPQESETETEKKLSQAPPEQKPEKQTKKTSKLWWLLLPVLGVGIIGAKLLSGGRKQ